MTDSTGLGCVSSGRLAEGVASLVLALIRDCLDSLLEPVEPSAELAPEPPLEVSQLEPELVAELWSFVLEPAEENPESLASMPFGESRGCSADTVAAGICVTLAVMMCSGVGVQPNVCVIRKKKEKQ